MSTDLKQATEKDLRSFGFTMATMLIVLFGLALPLFFKKPLPLWPYIAANIFGLSALIAPRSLRPVYILWMKFGHFAGAINTRIILGVIFFFLITPIGLLRRLMGADKMGKKFQPAWVSYRITSVPSNRGKEMERPF